MNTISILLVEDESDQRVLVSGILASEGYQVTAVESAESAQEALAQQAFNVVLSDWRLPGQSGFDLLIHVRQTYEDTAFIMVTAYGTIEAAVKAIRMGADDYLAKPYQREALLLAVERAGKARLLLGENRRLKEEVQLRDRLVDLVGRAPSMQQLFRKVEKFAHTQATVLLTGESGTGKELTARALHTLSPRSKAPFVAVNCAAIPEGLVESEFFGAQKGAYTGADRGRTGNFEAAHGGTLFLDEVGELPTSIQPKLLRALQEGVITRVGDVREIKVDVRVIAATNRDLAQEVREGRFREDLFYRLNVLPIQLPPLRQRREDIPQLARHFITTFAKRHGVPVPELPASVLRTLVDYQWPGNVRELSNVVERLILLAENQRIQREDLPPEIRGGQEARGPVSFKLPTEGFSWEDHEKDCYAQALDLGGGNRRRAAKLLGLSYKTFLYRLEKYDLEPQ